MLRTVSIVIACVVFLTGCSAAPSTTPEGPLALVAPPTPPAALSAPLPATPASASLSAPLPVSAPSAASSEGNRISYRLAPGLPESVPITGTQVAVMPESLATIDVWAAPSIGSTKLIRFTRIDEFAQPRVFRILAERGAYYEIQVPMRPNESVGYIRADEVDVVSTDQRILIDLSDRSVVVWDGDDVVLDTTGTIGGAGTPTPTGSYYVRNVFPWDATSIYGPYVIPLSAYSEAIDQINGGDAVVAIHGTQRPDLVGQAASLGCIRLENGTLRELAAIVEPGAPVEIVP